LPCCVVGFPLCVISFECKAAETAIALRKGAKGTDMVIDISAEIKVDWAYVQKDIAAVVAACARKASLTG
jgi:deoxyribose-phosphate aldolase